MRRFQGRGLPRRLLVGSALVGSAFAISSPALAGGITQGTTGSPGTTGTNGTTHGTTGTTGTTHGTTGSSGTTQHGATGATGTTGSTGSAKIVGPPPSAWTTVSNENTLTRWAYVSWQASIRSSPVSGAPVIGGLHLITEEHTSTVYEVLSRWVDRHGEAWLRIRVPLVRNSSLRGWVPATSLGPLHTIHTRLEISTETLRATLYSSGREIWSAPVGVGKPGTTTPHGHFYIREGLKLGTATSLYGVYAFGTSAYSPTLTDWPGGGVIGIHGTNQPSLIPGRPSHGCVRVQNPAMLQLSHLMPLGTPVWIH
jgi:L,D-transpeptidase catalytic domain